MKKTFNKTNKHFTTPILKKYIQYYYAMSNITEYLNERKREDDPPENHEIMTSYSIEVYKTMMQEKTTTDLAEYLFYEMNRIQVVIESLIWDSCSSCSITIEGCFEDAESDKVIKIGSISLSIDETTLFEDYIPTFDNFCNWIMKSQDIIQKMANFKKPCNRYVIKFFVDNQLTIKEGLKF